MTHAITPEGVYRVEVQRCSRNAKLFRWRILRDGQPIEIPGYAYATAWSASEAGRVALHWHLVLGRRPAAHADRPVPGATSDMAATGYFRESIVQHSRSSNVQPILKTNHATKRRCVFYMPGFDPRMPEAYWGLFDRESRLTAKRRGMTIEVGEPVRSADGQSCHWMVSSFESGTWTPTHYCLLRWDDIVRAQFPRSNLVRLIAIPRLWWRLCASGYIKAFWREAWQFASVIIAVHLMYVVLLAVSLVLATVLFSATSFAGGSATLRYIAIAIAAYLILGLLTRVSKGPPFYIAHLVDDTAFTHQQAAGRVSDMALRLDAWAQRIRTAEREASEIVVIGHSSASFLAVEALDRVLTSDPEFGRRGTPVTVLTLGGVIPWITLDPQAEIMRGALRRVAESEAIAWLDLRAPWDWLSIHRNNLRQASDLRWVREDRPLVRNVAIEDLIEPGKVNRLRWNFFRMHFQLLMSSRDPNAFDYIAFVTGSTPVHKAVDKISKSDSVENAHAKPDRLWQEK